MIHIKSTRRLETRISRIHFLAKLFVQTPNKKFVADSKVFETKADAFQWLLNRVGTSLFKNEFRDVINFDLLIISPTGDIDSFIVENKGD